MNIVLFRPSELDSDLRLHLGKLRAQQLLAVKGLEEGSRIRVGAYGGQIHMADVIAIKADEVILELDGENASEPLKSMPLTLLLALPRPQSLKKVLQTIAELGVEKLILTGAQRVNKSYFQSKILSPETIESYLTLGMQQAISTIMPEVVVVKHLAEAFDEAPSESLKYLAHPAARTSFENNFSLSNSSVIAIGPEGGWSDDEREEFAAKGYLEVSSGGRMLRVDTAVSALTAQFALLQRMAEKG